MTSYLTCELKISEMKIIQKV